MLVSNILLLTAWEMVRSSHDVIFEEFVDCSVMEKDKFADVQLDKTVLSEESLYQILRYRSKQETKGI